MLRLVNPQMSLSPGTGWRLQLTILCQRRAFAKRVTVQMTLGGIAKNFRFPCVSFLLHFQFIYAVKLPSADAQGTVCHKIPHVRVANHMTLVLKE